MSALATFLSSFFDKILVWKFSFMEWIFLGRLFIKFTFYMSDEVILTRVACLLVRTT